MSQTFAAVESRLARLRREHLEPALYCERIALETTAWEVPGEPVPFTVAAAQGYEEMVPGTWWGRPWGTTWLRIAGSLPESWRARTDVELLIDLGFSTATPGFQAEGLVYDVEGRILKALEPRQAYVPLPTGTVGDIEVYVEAASNPDIQRDGDFSPTELGDLDTAGDEPLYRYGGAHAAVLDRQVWELLRDLDVVTGTARLLPETSTRRACIVAALLRMLDAVDPARPGATAAAGRAELRDVLAAPAHHSAHRVVATGHAHIDSAWLWPVRETIRKCARTFSNMVDLLEREPDFVFVCSSAQQYAWVKQHYPELYQRIKDQVAAGRFVPVGGMWVESDTNMPGGEAMARQLIYGKRFFLDEFGIETEEVWLPDSFGYSAALPQIARAAGNRWFLTQKISWNDTNVMPHHTFWWEGIDGTRIFTHFPPVDTYNSDLSPDDLERAERQFSEKGRATVSLVPFGYGDGGGGPTREMVAAARRSRDIEGLPKVTLGSAREFFTCAEGEYPDAPVWSGELYLELHRGVLTSQARTKRGNRRCEHLLHEAELWAATASVVAGAEYPYAELERCWQRVLLAQFHDILPGSSIAWVYRDAEQAYAEVSEILETLINGALAAVAGDGDRVLVANGAPLGDQGKPLGIDVAATPATGGMEVTQDGRVVMVDTGPIRLTVDTHSGAVRSLIDVASGREVIPAGMTAGALQLHRDTPAKWDAWDIEEHYRRVVEDLDEAESVEIALESTSAVITVRRRFSASSLTERITVRAGSPAVDFEIDTDWHEERKLLKMAFPLAVHADWCAAETQFGHVRRPTHANTSWDEARFEICAHRWMHVGEPGFGVAVANDSTYGHDVRRIQTPDGVSATCVRLSLLRAPQYPDPHADQGPHSMRVRLVPGVDTLGAAAAGYELNLPVRHVTGHRAVPPLVAVAPGADGEPSGIVIETVKLADDRSGDVVVRLYEARGALARGRLQTTFGWDAVTATDLLERPLGLARKIRATSEDTVELELGPFQLATLRFARSASGSGIQGAGNQPRSSTTKE